MAKRYGAGPRRRMGKALVAMITIVDEEFTAVAAAGGFAQGFIPDTNYSYRRGQAEGRYDIVLAKSPDRGNPACTTLVAELVERFRPEYIILAGIAGGVSTNDDVSLGDVVIADHVDGYEMRKLSAGTSMIRRVAIDHPSLFLRETIAHRVRFDKAGSWKSKVNVARPTEEKAKEPRIIVGNLIAGEKLFGDLDNTYQKAILKEFDKALAVDMESYGLARGVYAARANRRYNLNYLIVRGISDLVDKPGNNEVRKEWRDYAAATAAATALSIADALVAIDG